MKQSTRFLLMTVLGIHVGIVTTARSTDAGDVFEFLRRTASAPVAMVQRKPPHTVQVPAVERLAKEIDWLEHHIDAYGTVVAKHPNVWGEARLTKHRDEYERMMLTQLNEFEFKLNGALQRSDQAYLAMALSLQAALTGAPDGPPPATGAPTASSTTNVFSSVAALTSSPFAADTGGANATPPISRTGVFGLEAKAQGAFAFSNAEISLEPTIYLDQMSRYLNHLHELRRINEGDDTADSPGYALNLVRIPISVLPGKHTRKGYGAEVTITATPYLSDELLPTTFRSLVINDVVDQLSLPLTKTLNGDRKELETTIAKFELVHNLLQGTPLEVATAKAYIGPDQVNSNPAELALRVLGLSAPASGASKTFAMEQGAAEIREELSEPFDGSVTPTLRTRTARMALPPSQVVDVYGPHLIWHIVADLFNAFRHDLINREVVHITDVEAFLQSELTAAYDLLSVPDKLTEDPLQYIEHDGANPVIWHAAGPELVQAIRLRDTKRVEGLRVRFIETLRIDESHRDSTAVALAWAIVVESALLNERLKQDMHEVAQAKGCGCVVLPGIEFYGSRPPLEAREAFNEYVRCRWPIQVFALDPVTQDQNIGDEFSRRRETQLALALAFAGGNINAQTMTRFSRRLEWDMSAIALNRTAIGFAHGNDTFGWRFHPRFQSPPIQGNLAAFRQTLFGGPTTEQDMNQRELEPGQRECVAVVLMPSFVPYCTFETRTNWFRLTNPGQTETSIKDAVHLSRAVTAMKQSAYDCAQYAHLYREGDVERMLQRVEQLDRELPLQTMQVQIPFENTAGGFELFNTGVTDLGPELSGWYGAPGVHPSRPTTLYLVGDHFSVHDTRVLAGGQALERRMISRQILEVRFSSYLNLLAANQPTDHYDAFVDVHVATPYGVSQHTLIPVVRDDAALNGVARWESPTLHMTYKVTGTPGSEVAAVDSFATDLPSDIHITLPPAGIPASALATVTCFASTGGVAVGSFTLSNFSFDARFRRYYVSGSMVAASIGPRLKPYLDHLLTTGQLRPDPLVITVEGRIDATAPNSPLPIVGNFTVKLTERK